MKTDFLPILTKLRTKAAMLRRKSRQPQIENSNEMHDIHCAIMVFMAEGHIALAGAMNREYAS